MICGANAILALGCVILSNRFDDFRDGRRNPPAALQSIETAGARRRDHGEARAIECTDSENPVAAAQMKSL